MEIQLPVDRVRKNPRGHLSIVQPLVAQLRRSLFLPQLVTEIYVGRRSFLPQPVGEICISFYLVPESFSYSFYSFTALFIFSH
jgi:hypothetical protein